MYALKRRALTTIVGLTAVGGILAMPAAASADPVGDLLNGLGVGSGGGGSQPVQAGPANSQAQGTVAAVDVSPPSSSAGDSSSGGSSSGGSSSGGSSSSGAGGHLEGEEVVVGRSRAEQQDDGSYQGHVTILALFGHEIIGIDTDSGETKDSPFAPLQYVFDDLCSASQGALCIAVLPANSTTTDSGSVNDFGVLRADSTLGDREVLSAGVAESNASLTEDGSCQTASAGSSVARADLLEELSVRLLQSDAQSTACKDGTSGSSGDSVIGSVNGNEVPLPGGCSDDNGQFGIASVASVSCNVAAGSSAAGSAESAQAAAVLEAVGDDPALLTAPASSTSTGAAASQAGPGGGGPGGGGPGDGGTDDGGTDADPSQGTAPATETVLAETGDGAGGAGDGGPLADTALTGDGSLAFTGSNALVLGLLGAALVLSGLMLAAAVRRRGRATA
jgi:hypothetical protein